MLVHEGRPLGDGRRVGIAVSRFNEAITSRLLEGARDALRGAGVKDDAVEIVHVPGAFELPLAADALLQTGRCDAVVALGAVVRGGTDHYDHICRAAADGLLRVGLDHGRPVLFGVLTCHDEQQALDRSGGTHGNKGAEVALDCLRTLDALESVSAVPHDGGAR